MNENYIRHIVREHLLSVLNEEEIEESPFTPAEEKFLAKFAELGTTAMGIIYAPNEIGIREFLGRSGKDFNLTPDVFAKLLKDKIISIVPYGGYSRNEDYTIQCNIPLDELEGLSSGTEDGGGESGSTPPEGDDMPPPEDDMPETPEVPAGPPEESVGSSNDLSKLLVAEAKKSKKKSKSKVHTRKARQLNRLPKGYILHLERIIEILGQKMRTGIEKEHMVADILDNLAHNFGLTPQQVYKSYIYYKTQNRLQNIIKDK